MVRHGKKAYYATSNMMETKIFGDKKITIRTIKKSDIANARKFQQYINSLVEEDAKILMYKRASAQEEKTFIEMVFKGVKNKTRVHLIAECDGKIIATTGIEQGRLRRNHIGTFGIAIVKGYRGLGLGKFLMSEIINLAKKDLKPKPRIIQLEAFANNKPAISLYKKMGLKIVTNVPKQIQYKGKLISETIMMKEI